MKQQRPRQFGYDYARRFKNRSLVESYKFRPKYPDETYDILLDLLGDVNKTILDVGCGTGKIARNIVEFVEKVDAVDFSEEMIKEGQSLMNGNHSNLQWIHGDIETVKLFPPYKLVTAGASIHWMDWDIVFPRFKDVLTSDGYLVIIDGDRPIQPPWEMDESALIGIFSTNQHYESIDLIKELIDRRFLHLIDDKKTTPINYSQSLQDYIRSFHSRESLSKEDMGEKKAGEFDSKLVEILSPYTDDNGILTYKLETRVSWGIPLT